ncbi:DNA-directed RNA polymerase, subunit G (RpoG) [Sulfolobus islandicus Y.N.15.51]|jgi:DNA-directed RNA polymerase subunit G|uniref:DNA-directed RNA polymerase subunit Rpo8 n=1 Tax=Saccharolobus islandicus (strain Y.N.15.51 / Yellowstone \|nr:DNA-directed RNA polymerase subunit G [Sulfolobus islandicus]ACP48089.1 DNA-directed RNA polymerase, subunit G (RpoG) [Sulfolobus islandicus Y.N.15.51]
MMESKAQEIILSCEINSIERGSLKNLSIIHMSCNDFNISFDIIDNINIFSQKEKVKAIISKNRLSYTNDDFCGHGYIVTELKDSSSNNGNRYTTIISLFGLLVKIISNKESFLKTHQLNVMDHIYFCVKKNT